MALQVLWVEIRENAVVFQCNTRSNIDMAKLLILNGNATKVLRFITVCRLYVKMRIIDISVKE